jgi:restriction system protein
MPVPSYDQFIEPLLRYLAARPQGVATDDVYEGVANAMALAPEERLILLPSGRQPVYKNRIGWAHDRLKRAGLSTSPKRGLWKLTPNGVQLVERRPQLTPEDVERIADAPRDSRVTDAGVNESPAANANTTPPSAGSPDETIEKALSELCDSVAHDLLERIGQAPPAFFERLVLELLHVMGYGLSESAVQPVGGPGDEGIDGVISLDRLGLEKVYIQAKRWRAPVGSPHVQGFMGALQLQGATKGVLLTTSSFTKDARDAAARARGTVVLVDGGRLTQLMIEHGVGVTHRVLKVPKIDGDYFEEG